MATSLQEIARQFGIDLLFSQEMVAGRQSPAISGRLRAEQALALLLAGSNLSARRTANGSYIIAMASVAESEQPAATPDILVIGRRTQNADIRRTRNDVRPYQVVTRQEIATSHVATVEELAAKRLPANAQGATLSQQGAGARGETASSIDLRGLGTAQTLILIDGRRLPQMPSDLSGYLQSDVNGLPPEAIDRVEAITATAGGVYGPGATAGVLNLVLRRDYRGIDLALTSGVTSRGDAPYRRANLRLGFTPDHGATDVMVNFARSDFGGLSAGERDFQQRRYARIYANYPDYYLSASGPPASMSLNIVSADRSTLMLKTNFGGASLGAITTFAPPADGRSPKELGQILAGNAGKFDVTPANNAAGGGETLLSGRRTEAIIASARHRSGSVELFADYLQLRNKGHARRGYPYGQLTLGAANPANPFVQAITVFAPDPDLTTDFSFQTYLSRLTGGLIIELPGGWKGEADYSLGLARRSLAVDGRQFTYEGLLRYVSQRFGDDGPFNPLGDYSSYLAALHGLFGMDRTYFRLRNRFNNASLRFAGPVLQLNGGPLTATLLAERQQDRASNGTTGGSSALAGDFQAQTLPSYGQGTRSFYGELRAPIVDALSGFHLLRGLEVQLALRHDLATTRASQDLLSQDGGGTRTVRNSGFVYTAGLKFSPTPGLLIRSSISNGKQPLTIDELTRRIFEGLTSADPKRPNEQLYAFQEIHGGPLHPEPAEARSMSIGLVLQPPSVPGLRASADYTHIVRRRENVVTLAGGVDYFLANEDRYPDRVARLPLTPADAALGYTAGRIARVDISSLQNGSTVIDALDVQVDYRLSPPRAGVIDLHAAATWQPQFRRVIGFGLPDRNFSGSSDGALKVRGNAGARWSLGPVSLSADAQFTGSYRIASAIEFSSDTDQRFVRQQGSRRVPPQATLDVGAEYRMTLPGAGFANRTRTLELRFGIQDVFDTRAVTVVNAPGGYNSYADPRQRRFELSATVGL